MDAPEYLICLECETPCYVFEWKDGQLLEALCTACGNEEVDEFMSEEDYEMLTSH